MTQDNGFDVSPSWQELKDELDRAERRVETMTDALRRARLYAGEHLEAKAGTGIIFILEKALREVRA